MELFLDLHTNTLFALRWLHFLAGVLWIGHLWFFNFVNANLAKALDADTRKKVVPELMPRALWMFRWGAMFTFLSGWAYLLWKQYVASSAGLTGMGGLFTSSWGWWITLGAAFGTIMWFNVWFIIWPAQRKIIGGLKSGNPAPAELVSRATMASKINTFLSVPLLFAMGGASHLPTSYGGYFVYAIIALGLGFALVQAMYKQAPKVSTDV